MSRAELEDLFNGEGTKPEGCGGSFLDTYDIAYKKYLLDTRLDIVQCPREACADIVEVGDEDSKVLVCATCGFAFCKCQFVVEYII